MASMCQKNHVIRIQEITMINWGLNKVWEVNRDNYEFMNLITNDLGEAGWKKLMSRSIFWKSKTGIALPNNWEIIFRSINQRQLPSSLQKHNVQSSASWNFSLARYFACYLLTIAILSNNVGLDILNTELTLNFLAAGNVFIWRSF